MSDIATPSTPDEGTPGPMRVRTINVEVPEAVYWHVRQRAIASRLSMKDYMTRFCSEAWDYPPEETGTHDVGPSDGMEPKP